MAFQNNASESRLADIVEFLPDAIFAINAQGYAIAWNRAMEDLTGWKAEKSGKRQL